MKIAIIDTGVNKEAIKENLYIEHFFVSENTIVNEYREPVDDHGTICFNEIIANSIIKDLQILDFNILSSGKDLLVNNIVISIQKAIEERVDIINISLGTMDYSKELYDVCEKAIQNNIVIVSASSHTNTISYPADFNNVICVKVNQSQLEEIKKINLSTISIKMTDFIFMEDGKEFDLSSSSLACARFCGYICNDLEGNLLVDKFKILSNKYKLSLYNDNKSVNSIVLKESKFHNILSENKVAIIVYPFDKVTKVHYKIFHKNIVAYYDSEKCDFYSISEKKITKDFDVIIVINTLEYDLEIPRNIYNKYKEYDIFYIGNFLNINGNKYLQEYKTYRATELSILESPVIAITSLCSGLNKSDIESTILNKLKQDGFNVGTITNNPLGILYDANVFKFPIEIEFPNIVYSINRFMYLNEINRDIDAWLINIGGGMERINNLNTYNFGKLVDAYLSSTNIDIVIMCITPSINIDFLNLQISYLHKCGVEKVFIVLSENDINGTTVDYKNGLQTYSIDEEKYKIALEYFKREMQTEVFGLSGKEMFKLYNTIINTLS